MEGAKKERKKYTIRLQESFSDSKNVKAHYTIEQPNRAYRAPYWKVLAMQATGVLVPGVTRRRVGLPAEETRAKKR